jgi:hypothetical protein
MSIVSNDPSLLDLLEQWFSHICTDIINVDLMIQFQVILDKLFYSLCEEHPGSVAIRQSFNSYKHCAKLDMKQTKYATIFQSNPWEIYVTTRWHNSSYIEDSDLLSLTSGDSGEPLTYSSDLSDNEVRTIMV